MAVRLEAHPLTWEAVFMLPALLRPIDVAECNGDANAALAHAMRFPGRCWEVRNGGRKLKGAFGWTERGRIWSLWSDLGPSHAKHILEQTPEWVRMMVEQSGRDFLDNYVDVENRVAIRWLGLSGSFTIDKLHRYTLNGRDVLYFRTKLRGAA